MLKRFSVMIAALSPTLLMAHPGHGGAGGNVSFTHYLSDPFHLILGIAILSMLVMISARLRSRHVLR